MAQPADDGPTISGNFRKTVLDDGDIYNPYQLDVAADGRVFWIEQIGRVKVWNPRSGTTTLLGNVPLWYSNDDGLTGIALDPNFMNNGWVYLYYTPVTPDEQVLSRFTITGNTLDLSSEKVLLHVPMQRTNGGHHAGAAQMLPDGTLYLSTGDDTDRLGDADGYGPMDERPGRAVFDAQRTSGNTNNLEGKILRIHPQPDGTYTIPPGNLFPADGSQGRPEIYVMGVREPVPIHGRPGNRLALRRRHRPRRGGRQPHSRAHGLRRGKSGTFRRQLRLALLRRRQQALYRLRLRHRDPARPVQPRGAGQRLAQQHRRTTCRRPRARGSGTPTARARSSPSWARASAPTMVGAALPLRPGDQLPLQAAGLLRRHAVHLGLDAQHDLGSEDHAQSGSVLKINTFAPGLPLLRPIDMKVGPDGALYMIEFGAAMQGGNTDSQIVRVDYLNNPPPEPRVTEVYVRGSTWSPAFKKYMEDQFFGDDVYGYRVDLRQGSDVVPWTNVDEIVVRTANTGELPLASSIILDGVRLRLCRSERRAGSTRRRTCFTSAAHWAHPPRAEKTATASR